VHDGHDRTNDAYADSDAVAKPITYRVANPDAYPVAIAIAKPDGYPDAVAEPVTCAVAKPWADLHSGEPRFRH
jgi:hypothetical protein